MFPVQKKLNDDYSTILSRFNSIKDYIYLAFFPFCFTVNMLLARPPNLKSKHKTFMAMAKVAFIFLKLS